MKKNWLSIAIYTIFFGGISLLPLFHLPQHPLVYEVPKVYAVIIWIGILSLLTLAKSVQSYDKATLDSRELIIASIFLLWIIMSSLLGESFAKSFIGNYYRADGLILLFALFLFSLICANLKGVKNWKLFVAWGFTISLFLSSSVYIFQTLQYHYFKTGNFSVWPGGAVSGTFGNPVFFAGYVLVCFPFLFYLWRLSRPILVRLFIAFIAGCVLVASYFTYTSTSIISPFLVGTVYLFLFFPQKVKYALVFLGIVIGTTFAIYSYKQTLALSTDHRTYIAESRPRIYIKMLLGGLKRPLTGYGWANADYAFDSAQWPFKIEKHSDRYVDKAHSHFIEMFATAGFVGLAIYISMIYSVITKLWKKNSKKESLTGWNSTLIVVLIIFVLHSQTNVISVSEELVFWFIVGEAI